jgi:subtilase family protein
VAVGAVYGLASEANVIAVKIWDNANSARTSVITDTFEWIATEIPKTGRPSIVNLSVTGEPNAILNRAISAAMSAGVHFVAAAGNHHQVAKRFPAGSECFCLESVNFQGLTLH